MAQPARNKGVKRPETAARDIAAAERARQALRMRAAKVPYQEIARALGYATRASVHHAVMRELDRSLNVEAEEVRKEELNSLEQLERECWKRIYDKKYEDKMLQAVDRILACQERRARLLGLDLQTEAASSGPTIIIQEVPPGYFGALEPSPEMVIEAGGNDGDSPTYE